MSDVQFLGEVPSSEFITGDQLASSIELTAGTSQYSSEPWLHFTLDGKEVYVAKKPLRHSVSWDAINAAGAVYGSKTVVINGKTYKVRLLKGGNGDPTTGGTYHGFSTTEHQGSEWNRLMYPIHSTTHTNVINQYTSDMGTLAQYSDADLLVHYTNGNGSYSWCQEISGEDSMFRVVRGYNGVSYGSNPTSSATATNCGWRPLLEEVKTIESPVELTFSKLTNLDLSVVEIVTGITALVSKGVTNGTRISIEGSNHGVTYSIFVPN